MYANEAPGLGIDIDEKLAAKYPVPRHAHLRPPLGHDPAARWHGDPALRLMLRSWSSDPRHDLVAELRPAACLAVVDAGLGSAGGHALLRAGRAQDAGLGRGPGRAADGHRAGARRLSHAARRWSPPRALLGVIFGLLRIAWIIVASIFLYHIAVETGQFQVMKESIAALSTDKRLQLILIAFCFGAFLEGTGGGGAPVAIAGSFLIGLGFEPFQAATLCLIANTAPVAWGAVGNPIRALATVTGLPEMALSAMTGRILPPLSAILPLWLVRSMVGWRADVRGLAGPGRQWALVRTDAVLLVELPGIRIGRHHRRPGLAPGHGRFSEDLAAEDEPVGTMTNPPLQPRAAATRRHDPAPLDLGHSQGMVSLPAGLRVHLRVEHAGDQRPAHPDRP